MLPKRRHVGRSGSSAGDDLGEWLNSAHASGNSTRSFRHGPLPESLDRGGASFCSSNASRYRRRPRQIINALNRDFYAQLGNNRRGSVPDGRTGGKAVQRAPSSFFFRSRYREVCSFNAFHNRTVAFASIAATGRTGSIQPRKHRSPFLTTAPRESGLPASTKTTALKC